MTSVKKPIKIFARLKPLTGEPSPYGIETVEKDDTEDEILVVDMKNQNYPEDSYHGHKTEIHRFRYTKVFERDCSQTVVFDRICRPVLDSALDGYNGTVFAYGQTGSGKTHTMTGSRTVYDERGIIPRALSYVFQKFQEVEDGTTLQGVYVSYLEIYNENGYDLLNPGFLSGRLEDLRVMLMEDGKQQIHLKNLSVHPVLTEDEALHLFYLGEHNRTIAETPMNEASTRSHCIFTVHLNTREEKGTIVRRSKVHLVDLAGSERIANSKISGQLLNEARHINLALHYLEQVIVALGETNRSHIPYRNSMMTSILRDSLGGNCMTSMIATLSVDPKNMPETLSTCRFSQRVALVTNDATLNEEIDPDTLISQLKAEVRRLKATIASSSINPIAENPEPLTAEEVNECWDVVSSYLNDRDEHAILAVVPDMRLIQTCFKCLKMACNMSKSKSMMKMMKFALPDSELYPQSKKIQDLLKTISSRDNEIQILTRMLREEKEKNNKQNFKAISGVDEIEEIKMKAEEESKAENEKDRATYAKLEKLAEALRNPPYSPRSSPKPVIDQETLLLDGVNDKKKPALENYLNSHPDKVKLENTRTDLLKRRSELMTMEQELNKNEKTRSQLRHVMKNSYTREELEANEILQQAYEAQTRTLQKQKERLNSTREEIKTMEEDLKKMYDRLLNDFQKWENKSNAKETGGPNDVKPLKTVAAGAMKSEVETTAQIRFNSPISEKLEKEWDASVKAGNKWIDDFTTNYLTRKSPRIKTVTYSPRDEEDSPELSEPEPEAPNNSNKSSPRNYNPPTSAWLSPRPAVPPVTPVTAPHQMDLKPLDPRYSDENENEIDLKNLMTGDPEADREIRSFFRNRTYVYKKLAKQSVRNKHEKHNLGSSEH